MNTVKNYITFGILSSSCKRFISANILKNLILNMQHTPHLSPPEHGVLGRVVGVVLGRDFQHGGQRGVVVSVDHVPDLLRDLCRG